jgi:CRP-like cAMP-binding protein
MSDGHSLQVDLVGKEGFIGLPLVAGLRSAANLIVTQSAGDALRIDAEIFRVALKSCPGLHRLLIYKCMERIATLTQIATCNALHDVDQKLARCLLMFSDRLSSNIICTTEDLLAQMLATRRASLSVACSNLAKIGLIQHKRGEIRIIDRKRLEAASCECYKTIRKQIILWQKELVSPSSARVG